MSSTAERTASSSPSASKRQNTSSFDSAAALLTYLTSHTSAALRFVSAPEDTPPTDSELTYPSSHLSPFANLLASLILSKPLSHKLGARTIRTVLNSPYSFTSPAAIIAAGAEKCHEALWDAKTQHKDKTADQILSFANIAVEHFCSGPDDVNLTKLKETAGGNVKVLRKEIVDKINGVGDTAAGIFVRRVQGDWEDYFPYMDERAEKMLGEVGIKVDDIVDKLKEMDWKNEGEMRWRFVNIVDVLVLAELEGKVGDLVKQAQQVSSKGELSSKDEDAEMVDEPVASKDNAKSDGDKAHKHQEEEEEEEEKEEIPKKRKAALPPKANIPAKKRKASTPSDDDDDDDEEEEEEDDDDTDSYSDSPKLKSKAKAATRGKAKPKPKAQTRGRAKPVTKSAPPPRRAAANAANAKRRKQDYSDDDEDADEDDFVLDDDDDESAYTASEPSGSEYEP